MMRSGIPSRSTRKALALSGGIVASLAIAVYAHALVEDSWSWGDLSQGSTMVVTGRTDVTGPSFVGQTIVDMYVINGYPQLNYKITGYAYGWDRCDQNDPWSSVFYESAYGYNIYSKTTGWGYGYYLDYGQGEFHDYRAANDGSRYHSSFSQIEVRWGPYWLCVYC